MAVRLKKRESYRKSNVFQFMKDVPGPKSNKELYNHVVQFLTYGNGTPKDAVEMLEDYGVDRKKAVGIVKSVTKGRMHGEMDKNLQYANRGASLRSAAIPQGAGYAVYEKVSRGMKGSPMGTTFFGYEAVQRYGVTPEEWKQAKIEGVVVRDEGGWEILHPYAVQQDPIRGARAQSHLLKDTRMSAKQRRTAKMDLMTGFTGSKPPDLDLGLDGNGYFEKWTTLSLPDTGKNSALDDEQQPSGGGAPATVAGIPLKVPMEAEDVTRPKLREGREARRQKAGILRKVASEIRLLDPVTARRLMAAADEISYDALSTATLPEAGDEANEVDDYQDNLGHGTLQFFGTDPAKSTSLTRESSRRRRTATEDFTRCEISFKYPGDNWEKVVCKSKDEYDKKMKELKEDGAEVKVRHFDNGEVDTNLQYANRGASRRRSAGEQASPQGLKGNVDWTRTLAVVEDAMKGKYDRGAVAHLLKSDFDRTVALLKSGQGGQNGEMVPGQQGQNATASRRKAAVDWIDIEGAADDFIKSGMSPEEVTVEDVARNLGYLNHGEATKAMALVLKKMRSKTEEGDPRDRDPQPNQRLFNRRKRARTQGDPVLKPEPTVGDQDGVGADGAGGFADRSKAPLQETMTAQDVERPKIRENPEAARLASLWNAFRSELIRQASGSGKWNSGRYALEARDYGDSVEVQASVVDRENLPMPVGSILFSRLSDSPRGRYATIEVNDGILENRTTEFTLQRPRQAGMIVRRLVAGVVQTSKDLIDGITT